MVNYAYHVPGGQKEDVMEQENYGAEQELETADCVEAELAEAAEEAAEEITEEITEEIAEEVTEELTEEISEEAPVKKTMKLWQIIVAAAASVVLLAALGVVLMQALGFEIVSKNDPGSTSAFANDYTGSEKEVKKAADKVIATVGDKKLTNKKLQLYYSMVVNDFVMNYYSYLSQVGLDYTKPLGEQKCYYDESISWEEYFVDTALQTWINYQSVALLAAESGYEMDAEAKKALEELPAQLDEQAKESGYEDADELLAKEINSTVEEYIDYWTLFQIGYGFTSRKPDAKTLEAYFNENSATFAEQGITKDSGPIVDVRHILIQSKDGAPETQKEWAACKKEAEAILKEWKSGAATEDSFAELANLKSADGGSNTTGGLYEGITKDASYVEPFLNWCMDSSRKVGDTGIVKTEFGYHIMYMSGTQQYWAYAAEMDYLDAQTTRIIEEATKKWEADTNKKKICIAELDLT